MRYIIDDRGYVKYCSNNYITCENKTCTPYEGTIPEGYETIEEWVQNANIRAYKIVDGNLVFDEEEDARLQEEYNDLSNDYSIREKKIGTWIDGKPIYRKVCELGSLPNNSYHYYDIGITNENATPINWTLLGHWNFGWKQYVDGPDLIASLRSDGFLLETQINMSDCVGILIIEYTKNTD